MRTPFLLKSIDDGLESLDIEVALDHLRSVVTLHMLEFDAEQVASFVQQGLPQEFNVRVDTRASEHALTLPRYKLVIALAGRHHPARLQYLSTGRLSIRLGDPDAAYRARCQKAIERVLQALSLVGIEAAAVGINHHGFPVPKEGFLDLFARTEGGAQDDEVHRICMEVGRDCGVDICFLRSSNGYADVEQVLKYEPHFAWDKRAGQLAHRNWSRR